jgi:hypothetical protein
VPVASRNDPGSPERAPRATGAPKPKVETSPREPPASATVRGSRAFATAWSPGPWFMKTRAFASA